MNGTNNQENDSFNESNLDLQFDNKQLNALSPEDRYTIEKQIVNLCLNGMVKYYHYLPNIKNKELIRELDNRNMESLNIENKLELYKNMYLCTYDEKYILLMEKLSLNDVMGFNSLIDLYLNCHHKIIAEQIKKVFKLKKEDKEYQFLVKTKLLNQNNFIVENKDILESVTNEKLTDDAFEVKDINGNVLSSIDVQNILQNNEIRRNNEKKYLDTVYAGLMGFAIGDALGVPVEFKKREDLRNNPITDIIGFGTHNVPPGTWSDDTSLVLATMDSIISKKEIDFEDMMERYCSWMTTATYSAINSVFDIGISTSRAIHRYMEQPISAILCGGNNFTENGNGSLMRMLPIIYYLSTHSYPEEKEVEIINQYSSMTHAHEISRLGCKIYYDYLKEIINNKDKIKALNSLKEKKYSKYYHQETISLYNKILSGEIIYLGIDDIKSSGYVVNTLEASIWSVLQTNNYKDTVLKAINLGGDTDTIGAISGSIAGILYQSKGIPKEWIKKIKREKYLFDMSYHFSKTLIEMNTNEKAFQKKI